MTTDDLNRIAETLMRYIVESDGIEVYRIRSNVALRWMPEVERAWGPVKAERAMREIVMDTYIYAAPELMKEYGWIEGFSAVEEDLQIRTDYPVLDVRKRIVPDPEAAEMRLRDLQEIQGHVNRIFRMAKGSMMDPKFYRRFAKTRGLGMMRVT